MCHTMWKNQMEDFVACVFLNNCHLDIWAMSLSSDAASKDPLKYLDYIVLKNLCKISKELHRKSVLLIHMQARSDDAQNMVSLTNNL